MRALQRLGARARAVAFSSSSLPSQFLVSELPLPRKRRILRLRPRPLRRANGELLLAAAVDHLQLVVTLGRLDRLALLVRRLRSLRLGVMPRRLLRPPSQQIRFHDRHDAIPPPLRLIALRLFVHFSRVRHPLLLSRELFDLSVLLTLPLRLSLAVGAKRVIRRSGGGGIRGGASLRLRGVRRLRRRLVFRLTLNHGALEAIEVALGAEVVAELFQLCQLIVALTKRSRLALHRFASLRRGRELRRAALFFDELRVVLCADGRLEFLVLDLRLALLEDVAKEEGGMEGFDAVRLVVEFSIGALDARARRAAARAAASARSVSRRADSSASASARRAASLLLRPACGGERRSAGSDDERAEAWRAQIGTHSESGEGRGAERGAPPVCWATVPRGRRSET